MPRNLKKRMPILEDTTRNPHTYVLEVEVPVWAETWEKQDLRGRPVRVPPTQHPHDASDP